MRKVPRWVWFAFSGIAAVVLVTWWRARGDRETDWTRQKEIPRPVMAGAPGLHGDGRQMGTGSPFRSRSYPASLISADCSVIGVC